MEKMMIPPQSVELEQVVLGALLLESDAFPRIASILNVSSFYHPQHQAIFKAIKSLNDASKPIDLMTVSQALKSTMELEKVGGSHYIAQLTSRVASTANIEYHAFIIAQNYIRREIIRVASENLSLAYDESLDVADLLSGIKQGLDEIENIAVSSSSGKSQLVTIGNALQEIEQDCVSVKSGKTPGITTGFNTVDKYTGGWRPTNLIILAARPGVGKTSLALHFALIAAKAGKWVNFYGLEMGSEDLMRIVVAGESGVNRSAIRDGKLQENDWSLIDRSVGKLEKLLITWYDHAGITAHQISANTRKNVKRGKCDLVIVDYLGLMSPTDKKAIREQQVSEMTRTLKRTSLENKVPIICLSQLNRVASETQPQLHHLRESGAIEQDADIVMFLWKDPETNYKLIIAKNRRGITGMVPINANQEMTKFYEGELIPTYTNGNGTPF